jgi:hypothetical protein
MAISIIVETGAVVAGANSFASVATAREYALNRGVVLPVSDDEVAAMLIKACDYIQAQESKFSGQRTSVDQELAFPRTGAYLLCVELPVNFIPKVLINAQCQLVIDLQNGIDLLPNLEKSSLVVREKIGPIETEYADPISVGTAPILTASSSLLEQLYRGGSKGFGLVTVRV